MKDAGSHYKTIDRLFGLMLKSRSLGTAVGKAGGFLVRYLSPRRNYVLIFCTGRSGSTLLKALLAEAPDTTNMPEAKKLIQIWNLRSKYLIYLYGFLRGKNRIAVMKLPFWPPDSAHKKLAEWCIPTKNIKLIVLIRNPVDSVVSLMRRTKPPPQQLLDFWCKKNLNLWNIYQLNKNNALLVKYEELVDEPKRVTREIFSFIGSAIKEGVDSYSKPEHFSWQWGQDDGGENIYALRVKKISYLSTKEGRIVAKMVNNNKECMLLCNKLGYDSKWLQGW